ncbi:MAG: hypothetical protein ABEI76_02760 [Halobacteriales archaeon]
MGSRRASRLVLAVVAISLLAGITLPVAASPALVSACPPCDRGFIRAATDHGLDTEVQRGTATVRMHTNGSATWTARVVPTNERVLDRLAENDTLARAVATDSFGIRYGSGIDHELIGTAVEDGAFVIRYRTLDVVDHSAFGARTLTYFRDDPGAYIYTELGAEEVTVVAPPGMTIAHGFGTVTGQRMTATALPDVRNGPFVVATPQGQPVPSVVGTLAVASALSGVIVRNFLLFVVVPGSILVGGIAGIRRLTGGDGGDPDRFGAIVALGGASVLVGTLAMEADALPSMTDNLILGGIGGAVLLALGLSVLVPTLRGRLTGRRLVGASLGVVAIVLILTQLSVRMSTLHRTLGLGIALLPAAVALGWMDATASPRRSNRLFFGFVVALVGGLVVSAPLTALGGGLFLLMPIILTAAAGGAVVLAIPLYLLGMAGGMAEQTDSHMPDRSS